MLADSPIQTLEQLAGRPVAFPGPEALVACKFSCAHLQNRKIPIDVVFAGNMDASFAQLYGAYRSFYQTAPVHLR